MEEVHVDHEFQSGNEGGNGSEQRKNLCGCLSPRLGLLAAGATEMALGSIGLALIVLGPQNRHIILYPLEEFHNVDTLSEQWEDVIQLLIEYWLPSLAYWIMGAVLIIAAIAKHRRMSLLLFWVFISTLLLAGSVAGILGLIVAGASIIGLLPLITTTLLQMYFYYAISDITYFHYKVDNQKPDDKEMLVIDSTV